MTGRPVARAGSNHEQSQPLTTDRQNRHTVSMSVASVAAPRRAAPRLGPAATLAIYPKDSWLHGDIQESSRPDLFERSPSSVCSLPDKSLRDK